MALDKIEKLAGPVYLPLGAEDVGRMLQADAMLDAPWKSWSNMLTGQAGADRQAVMLSCGSVVDGVGNQDA